jgi:hypothetical protein
VSFPDTYGRDSSSRTSERPRGHRYSSRTAIRFATAGGCGCTTAPSHGSTT